MLYRPRSHNESTTQRLLGDKEASVLLDPI